MNIIVLHHLEVYRNSLVKVLQNILDDSIKIHSINRIVDVQDNEKNLYIILEPEHIVERMSETLFVNFLRSSSSNFILQSFTTNFHYLNSHKIRFLPINSGVEEIVKELNYFLS